MEFLRREVLNRPADHASAMSSESSIWEADGRDCSFRWSSLPAKTWIRSCGGSVRCRRRKSSNRAAIGRRSGGRACGGHFAPRFEAGQRDDRRRGNVRILDFGIAAPLDDDRALRRSLARPVFRPRVLAGQSRSQRSDLFAWGLVVCYAGSANRRARPIGHGRR